MQGHVAVGHIVAQDEEPHGDVVACGGDGAASVLVVKHLEVIDDAVRDGLATVGTVAALELVGLVV